MSLIEETGATLKTSADHVFEAVVAISEGRHLLALGQGMLLGVAQETDSPALREATQAYADAVEKLNGLLAHCVAINDGIATVAERVGHPIARIPLSPEPTVRPIAVREPPPREGDPGTATPEQFQRYVQLEEHINVLIDDGVDPETIEGHIATGGICYIYRTPDGKIIKIPRVEGDDEEGETVAAELGSMWYDYATALKRGIGQAGLEQFVTYIDDKGVPGRGAVVCEMVPGKTFQDLSSEEASTIPAAHFESLIRTYQIMETARLVPDADDENLMYDTEKGFTVIDYSTREEWERGDFYSDEETYEFAETMAANFLTSLTYVIGRRTNPTANPAVLHALKAYCDAFGAEAAQALRMKLV